MNQENKTIEIEQMLTLSTNNISEEDCKWLDVQSALTKRNEMYELIVYLKGDYGFFIPLSDSVLERSASIPNTLAVVIGYAIAKGCSWIMFDQDAQVNKDLPFFEW
ncbi:hypothetical protein AAAC51_07265 [Priestia megaterium]